jgi:hypothetical protein
LRTQPLNSAEISATSTLSTSFVICRMNAQTMQVPDASNCMEIYRFAYEQARKAVAIEQFRRFVHPSPN